MSPEHIYAPYQGSRGIDIHPVDYQVRQCKTSADRGEDALADLEVDAKAPLHPSPPPPPPQKPPTHPKSRLKTL